MKLYIFPAEAKDVFFALSEDGVVLSTFGPDKGDEMAGKYANDYQVLLVDEPWDHPELQYAIGRNKLRAALTQGNDEKWARVELFRWQYGELPSEDDPRVLSIEAAMKNMAVAVASGEVTRESIAIVLVHLEPLILKENNIE